MAVLPLLLAAQQWVVSPIPATVGDTLWLERRVAAPAGWLVRPARLARGGTVEPLGDPVAARPSAGAGGGAAWVVRYPVTAWTAGPVAVVFPAIWLLGPTGEADSLPGGVAAFTVRSVLPDTQPLAPRPALAPVRRAVRWPVRPAAAVAAAAGLLVAGIAWRRRRPRPAAAAGPPHGPRELEVGDGRWLDAGEPRAVAARAAARLRAALARAVPEAHEGLSTSECLDACARRLPEKTVDELEEVLQGLDRVAFASAHGVDVLALARRARELP